MIKPGNDDVENHNGQNKEMNLRDYQLELAAPGLEGHNSIIVAPTGSGKTHVAIKICLEHIRKVKKPKIVFLAPVKTLAQQQFLLFKKFLDDDPDMVCQLDGDSDSTIPVDSIYSRHTVAVMTPQILVNMIKEGQAKINEISLIIFDECHNTIKKKPYNIIMNLYMDRKFSSRNTKLPQIIGMTASPGLRKVKDKGDAIEKVMSLMANLDVASPPVQVLRHKEELRRHQTEAEYELIVVFRDPGNRFHVRINRVMEEIEDEMRSGFVKFESVLDDKVQFTGTTSRGCQSYESLITALRQECKKIEDREASQYFMAITKHLLMYNQSLVLNDHISGKFALLYVRQELAKQPRNKIEALLLAIFEKFGPEQCQGVSPLLRRLKSMLLEKSQESSQLRCIIFAKTRLLSDTLATLLCEDSDLNSIMEHNTKRLTGSGPSSSELGMTKVSQLDTLKQFREGACKDIVATSVAEEGLDIDACNLIIDYNYSSDEVGFVQRKGRARAKGSKFVLLAYDDSVHARKMKANLQLARMTSETLNSIKETDLHQLKSEITKLQFKDKRLRELSSTVAQSYDSNMYKLSCLDCKQFATSSNCIHHINRQHRVVVDPDFPNQSSFEEVPVGMEDLRFGDEMPTVGKIFCGNQECRRQWGFRMRYLGIRVSVLKIDNFLITNDDGYKEIRKKWNKAPFDSLKVELTTDDLENISRSEELSDDDDD
ncbi:unnamed protein product [Clavelina lepadiformis]|uniref:Activating signal cointegrator 1 complex subunit 3 n=1 Tax=Clavelina lepadiformis TaxID=159417 RepID=A0ABP0GFL1_CLALP